MEKIIMESNDFDNILDNYNDENEPEFSERRRWAGRGGNVSRPRGGRLTGPQPQQGYVTRNEFNAAMEKVRSELAAASSGLRTLEGRVNTLGTGQERLMKEAAARKRENEGLRRDLKSTRELAAILPLISSNTKTITIKDGKGNALDVLAPSGNSLSAILPLLLLSGGDSTSGSGGSGGIFGGGSDNNSLLPLLLISGVFNK
jgi:hypothetical protein